MELIVTKIVLFGCYRTNARVGQVIRNDNTGSGSEENIPDPNPQPWLNGT